MGTLVLRGVPRRSEVRTKWFPVFVRRQPCVLDPLEDFDRARRAIDPEGLCPPVDEFAVVHHIELFLNHHGRRLFVRVVNTGFPPETERPRRRLTGKGSASGVPSIGPAPVDFACRGHPSGCEYVSMLD